MKRPTKCLLQQRGANKKEAQYHFTQETLTTITDTLSRNNLTHVLCIGAPTVMEEMRLKPDCECLLMDIDVRFSSFFEEGKEWIWYNMFNHHMFIESHVEKYKDFLLKAGSNLAVILDPPFGGKCELIGKSLENVSSDWRKINSFAEEEQPKMFWIFPYFMEKKITQALPCLKMSDYMVNYDNHSKFKEGGRKQGSPVRIFTNLDLGLFDLSGESALYKYCKECKIWVHKNNRHCVECGACTAKSGASYRHCSECERCVKQTWRHCRKCNRCALPEHPCQRFKNSSKN